MLQHPSSISFVVSSNQKKPPTISRNQQHCTLEWKVYKQSFYPQSKSSAIFFSKNIVKAQTYRSTNQLEKIKIS
jgi:hypothetical protein